MNNNLILLKRVKNGDKSALEDLAKTNFPLVVSIAKRYCTSAHRYEDLFQIGCIGLVKAINNFDLSYNGQLSTYAVPMIMGEIKRFLRDNHVIHITRKENNLINSIRKAKQELGQPSITELSQFLDIPIKEIEKSIEVERDLSNIYSLQFNANMKSDSKAITLEEMLMTSYDMEKSIIIKLDVQRAIKQLPDLQQSIIKLFMKDLTQIEIGNALGVSQVQVSRNLKKALFTLKQKLDTNNFNVQEATKKETAFDLFDNGLNSYQVSERLNITPHTASIYKYQYNNKINEGGNLNKRDMAIKLFEDGLTNDEVMEKLNITKGTMLNYKSFYNRLHNKSRKVSVKKNTVFGLILDGLDAITISKRTGLFGNTVRRYINEFEIIREKVFDMFKESKDEEYVANELKIDISLAYKFRQEWTKQPISPKNICNKDIIDVKKENSKSIDKSVKLKNKEENVNMSNLLRPVLMKGGLMQYDLADNDIVKIVDEFDSKISVPKEHIKGLIKELEALTQVI